MTAVYRQFNGMGRYLWIQCCRLACALPRRSLMQLLTLGPAASRRDNGVYHYLDDFVVVGPPQCQTCDTSLAILDQVCASLKIPMAAHKWEGPMTCLMVLGIVIDTELGQLRLPADKLDRLRSLLQEWGTKKACARKELESLIGLLNHACKVVRSGRSFLRRMLDLLHAVPHQQPTIRLNAAFRSDLAWWRAFLVNWNGVSFLPTPALLPSVELMSDASGSWGCGAWHARSWFQLQWDARSHPLSIAEKELLPIILACAIWGRSWQGHRVVCNQMVVACLRSRTSKVKGIMHVLRCLVFVEAHFKCSLCPAYINTTRNHLADDLSRNYSDSFLSKVPYMDPHPTEVPQPLLTLLLDQHADWTSQRWSHLFSSTFRMA